MCMQAHESYTVRTRSLLQPVNRARDPLRQISQKIHIGSTNSCCRWDNEPALAGMILLCLLCLHMTQVRLPRQRNPTVQGGLLFGLAIQAQKGLFSDLGLSGDKERRWMASTPILYMCPTSLYFTPHSMFGLLACSWWQRNECEKFSCSVLQSFHSTTIISLATHIAQHTAQSALHAST
jgi:hypothetical protein